MNYGIVLKVLGILLIIESTLMAPSLLISFNDRGIDFYPFLITIVITLLIGMILSRKKSKDNMIGAKDGLAIVALGWLTISVLGALPLFLSGSTPTYIDAFFEIVSGFTTTGSSLIDNIETLPRGILFWRSFTHWIGGMGILVFTIALLPALGIGGFQIYKAESPGPIAGKMAPRIKDTAKILYVTYLGITIFEVILLLLGKMSIFESLVHTFGTVGTGGFGIKGESIGYYKSSYIHIVISIFMVLSGISFSLYYTIYRGRIREIFKNEELRLYLGIIVVSTMLIGINLYISNYGNIMNSLRDSFFQVSSIITTTGYSTADFNLWPSFSKGILLILMLIGGSAGSTAGGIKVIRILVMFKLIKREILKIFHPRAVIPIKNDGHTLSNDVIAGIYSFIALYIVIFAFSTLAISLEGVDLVTASTSVIATLSNIGPGLSLVGPSSSFSLYSGASKLLLSFLMLLGRI
ncbi:MAG: TrkH family potassium uptake protein [Tissierella sp.]|uniref:TrkH family potassium uptake protein n=1 Tax=Tissierella sp. TaxID=41274 RepID=UPI003F94AE48